MSDGTLFDPAPFAAGPPSFDELVPDLRRFTCPVGSCNAKPGSPCKRPSGHTVWGGDVHAGRRRLAVEQAQRDAAAARADAAAATMTEANVRPRPASTYNPITQRLEDR